MPRVGETGSTLALHLIHAAMICALLTSAVVSDSLSGSSRSLFFTKPFESFGIERHFSFILSYHKVLQVRFLAYFVFPEDSFCNSIVICYDDVSLPFSLSSRTSWLAYSLSCRCSSVSCCLLSRSDSHLACSLCSRCRVSRCVVLVALLCFYLLGYFAYGLTVVLLQTPYCSPRTYGIWHTVCLWSWTTLARVVTRAKSALILLKFVPKARWHLSTRALHWRALILLNPR